MRYHDFIKKKAKCGNIDDGIGGKISDVLYPFQRHLVEVALKKARYCIFADCGLGKTIMQLEWARHVSEQCGDVLIFAPIAVAEQTVAEATKIGLHVHHSRDGSINRGVNITNYEKIHKFSPDGLSGVVLDESSILKAYSGKTKQQIIDFASGVRFRLACTATPAPNDYEEIGNHSEFVGKMRRVEMLSTFFSHDGGDTSKWVLKGHGEKPFWRWMASWSCALKSPTDIGYDGSGFVLPELRMHNHVVASDSGDRLFCVHASTLNERRAARKSSINDRIAVASSLADCDDSFLAWCNLNAEGEALASSIPGSVEVAGRHDERHKESSMLGFSAGKFRVMVTKPSIAGHGMNWQHCNKMAFVGLSDSYEEMYQAIRRCWRYGQKRPVDVHIVISDAEGAVMDNIKRKNAQADLMFSEMVSAFGSDYAVSSSYRAGGRMTIPSFLGGKK